MDDGQDEPGPGAGKMKFRNTKLAKDMGMLKGAATVFLNRNFMQLKSLQYKELQRRLERARLFLETRLPSDGQLRQQTLADLEDIWRSELNDKTIQDFSLTPSVACALSSEEKDLLRDSSGDDRTQLLVRQFLLEKGIDSDYSLPPSDAQVEEAIAYCLSRWLHPCEGPAAASAPSSPNDKGDSKHEQANKVSPMP